MYDLYTTISIVMNIFEIDRKDAEKIAKIILRKQKKALDKVSRK